MAFYFAVDDAKVFLGDPAPAPGVRVRFVIEKLLAVWAKSYPPTGDEGLVVYQDPTDLYRSPSRLWLVTDLERPVRVPPAATWLNCQAFTVEREVPAWLVAGPHGYAVQQIAAQARALTAGQVAALAALPDEGEEEIVRQLWKRWSDTHHRSGTPVGHSLIDLLQAVKEAARRTSSTLFEWDEDDGIEVLSDPAWIRAAHAANSAALAFGPQALLTDGQRAVLTRRWVSVFGRPTQ